MKILEPIFYSAVVSAFKGEPRYGLPEIKADYTWIQDLRGGSLFAEIKPDKVIQYISADKIKRRIIDYICSEKLREESQVKIDADHAKTIFNEWHGSTLPLEDTIYPVAFKSDDVYCWVKIPWDMEEGYDGKTPYFDSLFSRISNAQALKLWIGSLIIPQSDRQQYVWMYGEGGEGKSALTCFLTRLFGPTVGYLEPMEEKSQFFTSQIVGKRLAVVNECESVKFVTSGKIKSMVCGDKMKCEYKGENSFDFEPMIKLLISSNHKPAISGKTSDLRRLIYCQFEPVPEELKIPRKILDEKLWEEGKWFISQCVSEYYRTCPSHGEIPNIKDMAEAMGELSEMKSESIVNKYFDIQDPRPSLIDFHQWNKAEKSAVYGVLRNERFNDMEIHRFYEYIERKHKVILKRGGNDRMRHFFGMKLKDCPVCSGLAHPGVCPKEPQIVEEIPF